MSQNDTPNGFLNYEILPPMLSFVHGTPIGRTGVQSSVEWLFALESQLHEAVSVFRAEWETAQSLPLDDPDSLAVLQRLTNLAERVRRSGDDGARIPAHFDVARALTTGLENVAAAHRQQTAWEAQEAAKQEAQAKQQAEAQRQREREEAEATEALVAQLRKGGYLITKEGDA